MNIRKRFLFYGVLLLLICMFYTPFVLASDTELPKIVGLPDQAITIDEDQTPAFSFTFSVSDDVTIPTDLTVSAQSSDAGILDNPVTNNNEGTVAITLVPVENQYGSTTVTVSVIDGENNKTEGTFNVTIKPVNDGPEAENDAATTNKGTSVVIDVLKNDTDVDSGDTLTIASVGTPLHGNAVIESGNIKYTPEENYIGSDSFTYTISDGELTAAAEVNITVNAVNDAPTAVNDSATTDEDTGVVIDVLQNDSDPEGNTLTITSIGSGPSHGTAEIKDGKITYTPVADYNGPDSFSYTMQDKDGLTSEADVSIIVNMANDNPNAVDDSITIDEDVVTTIDVLANDTDVDLTTNPEWESLTVVSVTQPAHGSAVIAGDGKTVTYTPSANYFGGDSFSYTLSDKGGVQKTANVSITVNTVNDAPVPVDDTASTTEETSVVIDVLVNDTDIDGDSLSIVSVDTTLSHGTAKIQEGKITYTPSNHYNGNDSFSYTVSDAEGAESTATVTVTITNTNDAPVAVNDTMSASEDTSVVINVLDNDTDPDKEDNNPDDEEFTVKTVTQPGHGSVVIADDKKNITYTPAADYNGPDSFSYTMQDKDGLTSEADVNITVNMSNDEPNAVDDSITIDEDVVTTIDVLANDTDVDLTTNPEWESLTVVSVTQPAHGSAVIAGDGKTVTYTPSANYFGSDSFSYTLSDKGGVQKTANVSITVNTVNDAPVPVDDTASTTEETSVVIDVLVNDTDIDGDSLSIVSVDTTMSHGTAKILEGKITYTPSDDYNGNDSFSYTVSDAEGAESTATVTVTITNTNDAPVAVNDTISASEDTNVVINVLDNDTDPDKEDNNPDDEEFTVKTVTQPVHGNVVIADDKKIITYTPAADYNGPDSFSYTMQDKDGLTSEADVSITVNMANDNPNAVDDRITIDEDVVTTIDVLANDTDVDLATNPEWECLTVVSVTQPAHGSVVIAGDGKAVTYTPSANYFGDDSFSYTLSDKGGVQKTANVSITINTVNDAPAIIGLNDSYSVLEDGTLKIDFEVSDVETTTETLMLQYSSANQSILPNDGITLAGIGDSDPKCSLTLVPAANANGSVTVTIQLGDGFLVTRKDISIDVQPVNDAPVRVNDTLTFTEDVVLTFDMDNLVSNDTDIDGDVLHFNGVVDTSKLIGQLTLVDSENNIYKYMPTENFDKSTTFTYEVSDGSLTATATVTLQAIKVNDAPSLIMREGNPSSTDEDTEVSLAFIISDAETTANNLIVNAGSSNTAVIKPDNVAIIRNDDGQCQLNITPTENCTGNSTITLSVSDGLLLTTTSFAITVNPVDDPPQAIEDSYSTPKNKEIILEPLKNDIEVDGESLTITAAGSSAHSTIINNGNGTITYVPNTGFTGEDKFTYTISDGHSTSSAEITVNVSMRNYPPSIHPIANYSADEDNKIGPFPFVVDNPNGGSMRYSFTSSNVTLVPEDSSNIVIDGENKTITINPASNKYGTSTITIIVTDEAGLTATESFTVTFFPVNDEPDIKDITVTVNEDEKQNIDINILAGNQDVESSIISIVSVSEPSHGILEDNGDGIYQYTPYPNYNGDDAFTYTATDGECSKGATVNITVNPVNDKPHAYDSYLIRRFSDGLITIAPNDYDVDIDGRLPIDGIITNPKYGDAVISGTDIIYTPHENPEGMWDTIEYRVTDDGGLTDTAVIHIFRPDVVGSGGTVNIPPIVWDETHYINEDAPPLTIDLSNNYFDPDSSVFTLTADGGNPPEYGTIVINNESKTIVYTPNKNAFGSENFGFTITDEQGNSKSANIVITIYPINDPPSISPVADQTTDEETAVENIEVTISDVEQSSDDLSFEVFSSNSALLPDENITFTRSGNDIKLNLTPAHNQSGESTITILVSDGMSMATQNFKFTVTPANDPPMAPDRNIKTNEDTPVAIILKPSFADPDGDATTLTITTPPGHGSINDNDDGTVTYTPDENYCGSDSFVYQLDDGNGGTASGTVAIEVLSINDPPEFSTIDYLQTTDEDTAKSINFTLSDCDGPQPVELNVQNSNSELFPKGAITVSNTGHNYTINMIPTANASGETTIILSGSDGEASSTVEFKLEVIPINDLPQAVIDTATILEDHSVTLNVLSNDSDVEDSTLEVAAVTKPIHGNIVNNMDGTVTYTPDRDYYGEDSFNYTIVDNNDAKTTATVTITVEPVNDAPKAVTDSKIIDEDTAVELDLLSNDWDVEGDTITLVRVNDPTKGSVELLADGRSISYTPNINATGTDEFTYVISDGQTENPESTGTIKITLNPLNDPPAFIPQKQPLEFDEDTVGIFPFKANDPETPVQNLIIRLSSSEQSIVPDTSIVFTGSGEDKQVKFTPKENVHGSFNLVVFISDGTVTVNKEYLVTVRPINDPPSFGNYTASTNEDIPVSGTVSGTDLETALAGLTYTLKDGSGPSNGSVTVNLDGTWSYTPDADWYGKDSFVITLNDNDTTQNAPLTADGTVTVTVNPVNDAPAVVDDSGTTSEHKEVVINVVENDTDKDITDHTPGDDDICVSAVTQPAHGSVTVSADKKSVTYTPAGHFNGVDTFTYTAKDKGNLTNTGTVTVTVTNVNDEPQAVNDNVSAVEETPKVIDMLANDIDADKTDNNPDDEDLVITEVTNGTKGSVSIAADGKTVTYTPVVDFHGADSFTYTMRDAAGVTSTATVTVTVADANDQPTANTDTGSTDEDVSVKINILDNDTDADMDDGTTGDEELNVTAVTNPSNGTAVIADGGKSIVYTPSPNFNGTDSFSYTISDLGGLTSTSTVTITVTAVNDAPVNTMLPSITGTVKAGQEITADKGTWNDDAEMDATTISYTYQWQTADDNAGKNAADISGATESTCTIELKQAHKYIRVIVTASDDGEGLPPSQSTTAYSNWTQIQNSLPVISEGISKEITVDEDGSISFELNAVDTDNDTLNWSVSSAASHGTVNMAGTENKQNISYTSNPNYNGDDSFHITVSDGNGGTAAITVNVTVNAVNDLPVNTEIPTITGTMKVGQEITADKGLWNDDAEMKPTAITYTYVWQRADDSTGANTQDISAAAGDKYTITTDDAHKYIRVKVTAVDDGEGEPDSQSTDAYSNWVLVGNAVPVIAEGDTKETDIDVGSDMGFTLNASDGDDDALSWNISAQAAHGTAAITGTGNSCEISYTPEDRYLGSDTFTIKTVDSNGGEDSVVVTVNVFDRIKPVINLNGSSDITLEVGSVYTETATALDNYDGDITGSIVKTSNLDISTQGDYTITYDVTDTSGNRAVQVIRNIHVIPVVKQIPLSGTITERDTGSVIAEVKVSLKDMNGKLIAQTTTDNRGHYIFGNVKLGNYRLVAENPKYSTRTIEVNVVPDNLTDLKMVKDLTMVDFIITLESNPNSLIGDGEQTAVLNACIVDKDNVPIPGIRVEFSAPMGTFPNGSTAVTDNDGRCAVVYKSEAIVGTESKLTIVRASVDDDVMDLHAYNEIIVTFDPASIQGIVLDNDTKLPLEGAVVEVSKDFNGDGITDFYARMVTGPDGRYKVAVPKANYKYDLKITKPVKIGSSINNVTFNQSCDVGNITGTGTETYDPGNSIAGLVLSKQPDGSTQRLDDYSGYSIEVINDQGDTVSSNPLNNDDNKGIFQAADLTKDKTYKVAVTYTLESGEKLIVGNAEVTVNSDGQTSISTILIDPYGTITDASTKKPIEGVKVTLKYADTPENIAAGRTPNAVVDLPIIPGFSPSDNENPQYSTAVGEYAFMVFPRTDYIITATKLGYKDYTSEPIHVEEEIVQFNFSMHRQDTGSGSPAVPNTEDVVSRLWGQDRVDTALAIAKAAFTGKVKNVIIATSQNYPDALAGSVLAYKLQAPIVLVSSDNTHQQKVLSYIKEYMDNTGTVYILGGTGAVNAEMEQKVKNNGYTNVKRLGGADRYETAVKISEELDVKEGTPVVIASGENYPDALSISSIAAIKQYPIILVRKDAVNDLVKTEIARLKPEKVFIIGLQGAISTGVENLVSDIALLDKSNVLRIGGVDRYETSLEAAKYFDLSGQSLCAATGNDFPDIIAGSIYAANNNSPIILVDTSLSHNVKIYIKDKKIKKAAIFGGKGVVSKSIEEELYKVVSEATTK